MLPKEKAVDEFFSTLKDENEAVKPNIFETPEKEVPKEEVKKEVIPEKVEKSDEDEPHKNRRHRRLEQQLQQERELRIAAEARAQGRSEVEKFQESTNTTVPEKWLRIYGDTENSRIAWQLQKELLTEEAAKFKDMTLNEIKEEQRKAEQEQAGHEDFIDTELENLEEDFGADFSDENTRKGFLGLVEKLSPKDKSGNILEYADFQNTWELYQSRIEKPDNTRQREVASRSMQKSGGAAKSTAVNDATENYLREQGIIN